MARVKLSAIFTSLRGRYGGGVFRNHRGTTTLASLQSSRKEHYTADQVQYREVVGFCSKAWSALTVSEKDEWEEVAVQLSIRWGHFENAIGSLQLIRTPRGPYSGIDALISVHSLLSSAGVWDTSMALKAAPVGVTAPGTPEMRFALGTTAAIGVFWWDPSTWGTNGTASKIRIWGKKEDGTFYTQICKLQRPERNSTQFFTMRAKGSGSRIPLVNGLYVFQVDAINEEGLVSAPSSITKLII